MDIDEEKGRKVWEVPIPNSPDPMPEPEPVPSEPEQVPA